jgi:hypothetical protein
MRSGLRSNMSATTEARKRHEAKAAARRQRAAFSQVRSARDHLARAISEVLLGELPESRRDSRAAIGELREALRFVRLTSPASTARNA